LHLEGKIIFPKTPAQDLANFAPKITSLNLNEFIC